MKKILTTLLLLSLSISPVGAYSHKTTQETSYITTNSLRAVDGDTLYNKQTGEYYRLVDIDTPETGQCGYWEARNFLALYLVSRETVGVTKLYQDVYGRSVVEVDDLSYTLLKEGFAKPYIIDKDNINYKYYWALWYSTPHMANFGKDCP